MPGVFDVFGMLWRPVLRFLAAASVFAVLSNVSGQQVSVQDRSQLLRTPTTPTDPYSEENGVDNGVASESPNDADIGEQQILKRVERYEPFTASIATPFYYTSNVALTRNGEQSDVLVAPAAGVTYAPRITRTLYGSISVYRQEFYYGQSYLSQSSRTFSIPSDTKSVVFYSFAGQKREVNF